jgi:predicted transcriptional regulator of viral defense system
MARPRSVAECGFTGEGCASIRKARLAALAARQRGRVRSDQLRALGISARTIGRWCATGYLHRVLPGVYAVGHAGRTPESDLAAAVLYAGPGAMLSHGTALCWRNLIKYPPPQIHVSTPRDVKDHGNVKVHGRRRLPRVWHEGLPTTTPSQALLDFAATGQQDLLRLALANADYQGALNVDELQRLTGSGIKGSAALRAALTIHLPELARTRSPLEVLLLTLCQKYDLPIPLINVYIEGHLVDACWPGQKVIVEVDGATAPGRNCTATMSVTWSSAPPASSCSATAGASSNASPSRWRPTSPATRSRRPAWSAGAARPSYEAVRRATR